MVPKIHVGKPRWWAQKIGKPFALPEGNGRLGIENRTYVQGQGKQTALDPDKLAQVKDEHLRLSLELQAQFGLRREEAIKFQPAYAIRTNGGISNSPAGSRPMPEAQGGRN